MRAPRARSSGLRPAALRTGTRPGVLLLLVRVSFFVRKTVPFPTDWMEHPLVSGAFYPDDSEAARLPRPLVPAPVFIEAGSVVVPPVLKTLAASPDTRVAVPVFPMTMPSRLLASPPRALPFWLIATRRFPEPLAAAGWTICVPVQTGKGRALQVFRVSPPAPPR